MEEKWTIHQVEDLSDKIIIVTGGNSGLGYEAVKVFASKGAKVIMACRSMEKAKHAFERIYEVQKDVYIDLMELDLSSLESIKRFAKDFKARYDRLDILLNNAGIMTVPYGQTVDGFESQLGINHLGHFALTGLLFELLSTTKGARVVNISSMAHKSGVINFGNLMFDKGKGYTPMKAYAQSKLANLLFTYELQRKVEKNGLDIKVIAAHPGVSNTNLARNIEDKWFFKRIQGFLEKTVQPAYEGALPGIFGALDPGVKGGQYYGPGGFMELKGEPILVKSSTASYNKIVAHHLWSESEKLTGVLYPNL